MKVNVIVRKMETYLVLNSHEEKFSWFEMLPDLRLEYREKLDARRLQHLCYSLLADSGDDMKMCVGRLM